MSYVLRFDNGEYWTGSKTTSILDNAKQYISVQQALDISDRIYWKVRSRFIEIKNYDDCLKEREIRNDIK